jgi:hypothetical protein
MVWEHFGNFNILQELDGNIMDILETRGKNKKFLPPCTLKKRKIRPSMSVC